MRSTTSRSCRFLDLSRNSLEQLAQIHLMGLSNLLSFNVSENRLTSLPEALFHGCSRLRVVDLSRNFIRDVHLKAFSQVIPSLEVLHLERNQIDRITTHLFDSKTLKEIYLDNNLLTAIDVGAFGARLSVISIQNSHLVELQSGVISGFDNLQNVTIANNPWLKSLSNMTLGGESSKVSNLNLANNALTSLSPILVRWGNMTSVNLTGNEWNCDCTMTWMMDSVHGDQVTYAEYTTHIHLFLGLLL